ncbi:MAG: VCBS repeat-containing protein, partial [Myxococcales bacterium]|nr:VCBS repeat-containing protein [Myxococcales bacterium]
MASPRWCSSSARRKHTSCISWTASGVPWATRWSRSPARPRARAPSTSWPRATSTGTEGSTSQGARPAVRALRSRPCTCAEWRATEGRMRAVLQRHERSNARSVRREPSRRRMRAASGGTAERREDHHQFLPHSPQAASGGVEMGHRSWKAALAVWVVVGCGGDVDSPPDANVDGSSEVVLDPCDSNRDCSGGEICREGSCRVACEDATECSAPLALCDDARGYCVACIDDDDCATHATCEASFCTFFCRDDSACAADERCIVDSGVCTERECESARECEGGFRCEGFVCVPIDDLVCEAGEEACSEDATTALRCNDDGTMEARETCDEGARCVTVDEAAVCREIVCPPAERGCTDVDTTFACDTTGTERTETDCAAGRYCDAGECRTRTCTPGAARCDASGGREVCDEAGTGYVASPCATTDVCVDGVCLERLCERGSARCVEGSWTGREVCGIDERSWVSMPCRDDETCAAGSCETRVCTPTMAECVGSDGSRECLPTGLGYTATVSCPSAQSCTPETGRCGAWICTPASTSCESLSTLRTCNADGLGHATSACAATESCSAGACRPHICAPGAFSCADVDTRRLCAADGLGYTSAPCTGSDPDGYSCTGAGTCVARVCAPGSVDATCASLTDRRVCNADGSGYLAVGCAAGQSCEAGGCAVRCGDGIVGGSEACDDGNLREGDTCSTTCTAPPPLEARCASTRYHSVRVDTTTGERMGWHVADLDGDGHLDLLGVEQAGNRMVAYYGDGDGRFSSGAATSTGRNNGPAAIVDLDGDG